MSAVLKQLLQLIPMRADRLDEIHSIEADIYEYPWSIGNLRDSITAGYECFEYRSGHLLIGYAVMMVILDDAHLLNLSIARAFQRQGFGKSLLGELSEIARRKAAKSLLLEVRPSNIAARGLYAGAGFLEAGIRRGYYPAVRGREDAIVLKLAL